MCHHVSRPVRPHYTSARKQQQWESCVGVQGLHLPCCRDDSVPSRLVSWVRTTLARLSQVTLGLRGACSLHPVSPQCSRTRTVSLELTEMNPVQSRPGRRLTCSSSLGPGEELTEQVFSPT